MSFSNLSTGEAASWATGADLEATGSEGDSQGIGDSELKSAMTPPADTVEVVSAAIGEDSLANKSVEEPR